MTRPWTPIRLRGPGAPDPFVVVPQGTPFVSVRLEFRDGTQSDIVKFPAP